MTTAPTFKLSLWGGIPHQDLVNLETPEDSCYFLPCATHGVFFIETILRNWWICFNPLKNIILWTYYCSISISKTFSGLITSGNIALAILYVTTHCSGMSNMPSPNPRSCIPKFQYPRWKLWEIRIFWSALLWHFLVSYILFDGSIRVNCF